MTSDAMNTYLQRLQRALSGHAFISGRVTDEVREHLNDAVEAGIRRGLSTEAATADALSRFGDPARIAGEFHRIYRWDRTVWYLMKVALSVLVSVAVALAVEVLINVRIALRAEALRLAPGFPRAALISVAIVVGLAAAWEIARRPFDRRRAAVAAVAYAAICSGLQWAFTWGWMVFGPATGLVLLGYACARFERRPRRLVFLFAAFAISLYAAHIGVRQNFGAREAVTTSGTLLLIWISTLAILERFDRAFLDVINT